MTSIETQKTLCYNGGLAATQESLAALITRLDQKRFHLVQEWREGGQTNELWSRVEALDIIRDRQENAMSTLESHKIV